jgi:hypothetical protein
MSFAGCWAIGQVVLCPILEQRAVAEEVAQALRRVGNLAGALFALRSNYMPFSHSWSPWSRSSIRAFAVFLIWSTSLIGWSADTVLVNRGDVWRYRKGKTAPQTTWRTTADSALDISWLSGKGGFGYSDSSAETGLCLSLLTDMKGSYTTLGFRKTFQVAAAPDASAHLYLTMDWDDGFIAWLDGVYLTSDGSPNPPNEPAFGAVATGKHESSLGDSSRHPATRYDLGPIGTRLSVGSHILSVMGLNQDSASSDFVQVAELSYGVPSSNCMSGSLASSTVWRLDQSPVVVCGDVTVESGVTLTIEAGVILQLAEGVSLIVADGGKLVAEGTPAAPLLFTRASGASNWGSIVLRGSEGSPETKLAHAHFEFNAASTKTPCIEVAAGTADLAHLTFGNTGAPYIHVDGASFVIRDCNFPSATTSFELVHGTGGVKVGGHGTMWWTSREEIGPRRLFISLTMSFRDLRTMAWTWMVLMHGSRGTSSSTFTGTGALPTVQRRFQEEAIAPELPKLLC